MIRSCTVLSLVLTLGLHWALLQTLAWTGMIISYSRVVSFSTAVRMTFDGQHPCQLCCQIKEGKKAEKKSPLPELEKKMKLFCEKREFSFRSPMEFLALDFLCSNYPSHSISPPKPPPRRSASCFHCSPSPTPVVA